MISIEDRTDLRLNLHRLKIVQEDVSGTESNFACMSAISWNHVLNGYDSEGWKRVIVNDREYIIKKDTFSFVDCKKAACNRLPICNQKQIQGERSIERKKFLVVRRRFNQQPGVDFYKTFGLAVRLSTIRLLLVLCLQLNLKIQQVDIFM